MICIVKIMQIRDLCAMKDLDFEMVKYAGHESAKFTLYCKRQTKRQAMLLLPSLLRFFS